MSVPVVKASKPIHTHIKCAKCSSELEFPTSTTPVQVVCWSCTHTTAFPQASQSNQTSQRASRWGSKTGTGRFALLKADENPISMEYYDILQVPANATQDEIRKKYYKLAIKHHPDKSSESDAEEKFKQLSKAYQVLSDPDLRRKYNMYGEGTPEGGFTDPEEFFQQQFGGDKFVDIIGKLSIAREFRGILDEHEMPDSSLPEEEQKRLREEHQKKMQEERDRLHKERVETLTVNLRCKLDTYADSDGSPEAAATFVEMQRREAEELKVESHGVELLHAIGHTYLSKSQQYIGKDQLFGLGKFFQQVKEKGNILQETFSTIKSAVELQRLFNELQEAEKAGKTEERERLEQQASQQGMKALWKGSKLEVQSVLREVCDVVLSEKTADAAIQRKRAMALKMVGETYLQAKADPVS